MSDLREMPFVRKMTNRYMSRQISRLCRQPIPDTQCGFRMIRADLFAPLAAASANNYDYETEMLGIACHLGHRVAPASRGAGAGEHGVRRGEKQDQPGAGYGAMFSAIAAARGVVGAIAATAE